MSLKSISSVIITIVKHVVVGTARSDGAVESSDLEE